MKVGNGARALAAWQDGLEDLAIACCASAPEAATQCLDDFIELIGAAPTCDLRAGLLVEMLGALGSTNAERAVLSALGPDCSFMISRSSGGMFISSVCLPGCEEEATASGSSIALATLGAICIALVERAAAGRQDHLPGILPSAS